MKKRTVFITLYKEAHNLCDYPKGLPVPKIGETVIFENGQISITGTVYDVRHVSSGEVSEIKICVK